MYDLENLIECSEDVMEYIEANKEKAPKYMEQYESYRLEWEAVTKIKCHADKYTIIAFSAEWCPDCFRNIPHPCSDTGENRVEDPCLRSPDERCQEPKQPMGMPTKPGTGERVQGCQDPPHVHFEQEGSGRGRDHREPSRGQASGKGDP
ncbi:hypothetical protein HN807_09670 [Candidatus Bathyarchaeota archaeon]|nr:hypothetical protein [Candidatus Bathyarchaeota archaeon]MBT4320743.1 hypothetical protein [Candidatus Bathyarchaeota archaeon]MBT4424304.1 hypothetical protein [Candidatus Bathyarchaeota archaeon]MBT5641943.1 hypothetical protein [Candidatus Bathyarchaeota archaeon]MBT6604225.1 hypothetical protein [Candidatus Bathyarchaeota archaeon]